MTDASSSIYRRGTAFAIALSLTALGGSPFAAAQPPGPPGRDIVDCVILRPPPGGGGEESTPNGTVWPNGLVPFLFSGNVSASNRDAMLEAMDEIQCKADITFVPRTFESNYVFIQDSTGNNSYVGMIGGGQTVNIYNWNYKFIMCHELLHALGFEHEQSRFDRDTYVQINYANICQNCCSGQPCDHNFNIANGAGTVGPYDFDSVMHYGPYGFSVNGQPTITVLAPYQAWQNLIGQRTHLSDGDISGLVARYGVPQCEPAYALALEFAGESTGDRFGHALALIPSIDGDAIADVIVGAPMNDENGNNAGKVYLLSGATGAQIWSKVGQHAGDQFGAAVAVNGGRIMVGAPFFDGAGGTDTGKVYLYNAFGGALVWSKPGKLAGDQFGFSLAANGDANNDGEPDLLIGAPKVDTTTKTNVGQVSLYSGVNFALLKKLTGQKSGDAFGTSVAFVRQTGADSILVGAPNHDSNGSNNGKAYLYHGTTYALELSKVGEHAGDKFGTVVAGTGELTSFPSPLMVVAAPMFDRPGGGGANAGKVYAFLTTYNGHQRWSKVGTSGGDRLGSSISTAGDPNGDGNYDVLVGAPQADPNGANSGKAFVLSGEDGEVLISIDGAAAGDRLGASVACRIDPDSDGRTRMAVAGTFADASGGGGGSGGADIGRAYLYQSPQTVLASPSIVTRPADIAPLGGNGFVNQDDLLMLINAWGPCAHPNSGSGGRADINHSGTVDTDDLLLMLSDWG
jgi:hypothetical protein